MADEFWGVVEGETLREKILNLVRQRRWVSFAELIRYLGPETRGDYAWWLDESRNLLIWAGLSEEVVETLQGLVREGTLAMKPSSLLVYLVDGRVPRIPVARGRYRYRQPHWVPVVFDLEAADA